MTPEQHQAIVDAQFIVTEVLEEVGEVCRCEEDRKLLHDIAAELRQEDMSCLHRPGQKQ